MISVLHLLHKRFLLTQLPENQPQPSWIGMKCLKEDQSPIWSEDENFDLSTVSSTEDGEKTENNTCVEMHTEGDTIVWEDARCHQQMAYVCKISLCRRGLTAFDGKIS